VRTTLNYVAKMWSSVAFGR